jgi:beta-phosphoglucomutase-like phosphatase (HAD superfamily)
MNNTLATMIPFDPTKYDGYIFDCDGTLADTLPLHYRTWNKTCEKFTASDSKCQT